MAESIASLQADNCTPPRSSAIPGEGISVFAASTAATSQDLFDRPDQPYNNVGYFDRYVNVMACGGDIWISFSGAAVTVNPAATGTGTTTCWLIKDGVKEPWRLDRGDRFVNFVAVTGTPTLRICPSSQNSPSTRRLP